MTSKQIKFAQLHKKMVYSAAYQDLNAPTLKILSYLLLQLKWVKIRTKGKSRYEVANKNEIQLLYSTFIKKPFYMNRNTITRSIDSLLAHGFIKVYSQGGKIKGHATKFSISNEWESWKEGDIISVRRPYHKRGFALKHGKYINRYKSDTLKKADTDT